MRERAQGGQAPCRVLCGAVGAAASGQAVSTGKKILLLFHVRFGIGTSSVEAVSASYLGAFARERRARRAARFFFFLLPPIKKKEKERKKAVARHVAPDRNGHLASRFLLPPCTFAQSVCSRGKNLHVSVHLPGWRRFRAERAALPTAV